MARKKKRGNNKGSGGNSWGRSKAKASSTTLDTRKVFVGGLPSTMTTTEFREFFERYGVIIDAVVMYDRETKRSRGFGFITFKDEAVVHKLLEQGQENEQNGATTNSSSSPTSERVGRVMIHGKQCEVKSAVPKKESPSSSNHDSIDMNTNLINTNFQRQGNVLPLATPRPVNAFAPGLEGEHISSKDLNFFATPVFFPREGGGGGFMPQHYEKQQSVQAPMSYPSVPHGYSLGMIPGVFVGGHQPGGQGRPMFYHEQYTHAVSAHQHAMLQQQHPGYYNNDVGKTPKSLSNDNSAISQAPPDEMSTAETIAHQHQQSYPHSFMTPAGANEHFQQEQHQLMFIPMDPRMQQVNHMYATAAPSVCTDIGSSYEHVETNGTQQLQHVETNDTQQQQQLNK